MRLRFEVSSSCDCTSEFGFPNIMVAVKTSCITVTPYVQSAKSFLGGEECQVS